MDKDQDTIFLLALPWSLRSVRAVWAGALVLARTHTSLVFVCNVHRRSRTGTPKIYFKRASLEL
jgi:hypothetical protein